MECTTTSKKGKIICFETYSTIQYLDFLEELDYCKYKIINISHGDKWYITYRAESNY